MSTRNKLETMFKRTERPPDRVGRCLATYTDNTEQMPRIKIGTLFTIHNHFHIVHQTVDNLQDVGLHHAGLVLGEPVQSAQYILDLAVAQQLLCELLCKQFRNSNRKTGWGTAY